MIVTEYNMDSCVVLEVAINQEDFTWMAWKIFQRILYLRLSPS